MDNFDFYSPTYFAFGDGQETRAGELVRRFGGSREAKYRASVSRLPAA